MSELDRLTKITDELEKQENFWRDKEDDTYGVNLAVCMAINSIRQSILSVIAEEADKELIEFKKRVTDSNQEVWVGEYLGYGIEVASDVQSLRIIAPNGTYEQWECIGYSWEFAEGNAKITKFWHTKRLQKFWGSIWNLYAENNPQD